MNQEPQKCPPHLKRCLWILRVKCLSGCFGQQNFKPHSEHWTLWTLPFVFCLPISREERHLHSVQWSSPQCFLNWKFQNFFKRYCTSDVNNGRCKVWARQRVDPITLTLRRSLPTSQLYTTLKRRMRTHPQGNIDSSLILLCQLVCGRCVPCNISIRCNAAGEFFCFVSIYFFGQLLIHRASKIHPFESKPNFSLNLEGKKTCVVRFFHCSRWFSFSVTVDSCLTVLQLGRNNISRYFFTEPKLKSPAKRDLLMPAIS